MPKIPAKKQKLTKAKSTKKPTVKPKKEKALPQKTKSAAMDDCEQCLVLAAIINQKCLESPEFRAIPLPDINSSALAILRDKVGEFPFTQDGIKKAAQTLLSSHEFKKIFPVKEKQAKKDLLHLSQKSSEEIVSELLLLAGPLARHPIYVKTTNPVNIHKSTLEKYALETKHIHALPHHENPAWTSGSTVNKSNTFMQSSIKTHENQLAIHNFASRQKRGRG